MANDDISVTPGQGKALRAWNLPNSAGGGGDADKLAQVAAILSLQPVTLGGTTLAATASAGTLIVPTGASHVLGTVDDDESGNGMRYWEHGGTPDATHGLYVPPAGSFEWTSLSKIKFVSTGGTVLLNVSYRGYDRET